MSRHGYEEDCDIGAEWSYIRHRGAIKSALRGKRGQAFLRELLAALDELPEKKLITGELVRADGCACALGAVALKRGIELQPVDPEEDPEDQDWGGIGGIFGVADVLAKEVMYENDDGGRHDETPEQRFVRMRRWAERQLIEWEA